MGLDTVEIVIRFEDAFGIAIPDQVAAELTTPRKVTDYVLSQLALAEQTTCMSQQAFYRLRKEFVPALGIKRFEFQPKVKLAQLIPVTGRMQIWNRVRSQIGEAALPDLVRPTWLFLLLTALTMLTAFDVFIQATIIFGSDEIGMILSLLVVGALGYGSARLTRPMKREFHRNYVLAGDLAKYLVQTPRLFKKMWTREEVATTVRQIIIDETGNQKFTEDSRFIEDMNLE